MNETKYSIKNPFQAEIIEVKPINKEGSTKNNNHAVISLKGSGITYEAGCSFGLLPSNPEKEVKDLLDILDVDGDTIVTPKKVGKEITVYDFFLSFVNLQRITKKLAEALLPHQKDQKLHLLLDGPWKEYTATHDLVEFLRDFYQKGLSAQDLADICPPMLARFYSVASSNKVVGDNIHLLLADFEYIKGEKLYRSITTNHILTKNSIRIFHQKNPSFHPPKDDTPIIMIGPGTGIAAFRAFLQERIDINCCKNNVLFTGDRNRAFDFYYEEELTAYKKSGHLQLFTAFSRDHAHKVYVQDRMWDKKDLLFELVENKGAHIFVSGDAERMAKDVTAILEKIFATKKSLSPEEAHLQIKSLIKQKRMHLDVY